VKVWFRVNQMDVEILARPTGKGKEWEPYAMDYQLGEFYLTETDEIEMREGDGEWFPVPLTYVIAWFNQPIS
jgi:hypothetical protein